MNNLNASDYIKQKLNNDWELKWFYNTNVVNEEGKKRPSWQWIQHKDNKTIGPYIAKNKDLYNFIKSYKNGDKYNTTLIDTIINIIVKQNGSSTISELIIGTTQNPGWEIIKETIGTQTISLINAYENKKYGVKEYLMKFNEIFPNLIENMLYNGRFGYFPALHALNGESSIHNYKPKNRYKGIFIFDTQNIAHELKFNQEYLKSIKEFETKYTSMAYSSQSSHNQGDTLTTTPGQQNTVFKMFGNSPKWPNGFNLKLYCYPWVQAISHAGVWMVSNNDETYWDAGFTPIQLGAAMYISEVLFSKECKIIDVFYTPCHINIVLQREANPAPYLEYTHKAFGRDCEGFFSNTIAVQCSLLNGKLYIKDIFFLPDPNSPDNNNKGDAKLYKTYEEILTEEY